MSVHTSGVCICGNACHGLCERLLLQVQILKQVHRVGPSSTLLGQYAAYIQEAGRELPGSNLTALVPTFAAALVKVGNVRVSGCVSVSGDVSVSVNSCVGGGVSGCVSVNGNTSANGSVSDDGCVSVNGCVSGCVSVSVNGCFSGNVSVSGCVTVNDGVSQWLCQCQWLCQWWCQCQCQWQCQRPLV